VIRNWPGKFPSLKVALDKERGFVSTEDPTQSREASPSFTKVEDEKRGTPTPPQFLRKREDVFEESWTGEKEREFLR